eukprot:TRINITY_DN1639_c0_g3_i1.p1 TRINITY_DN1639_c0_g3~~TRINITY_DN1639_c0_g3_i1.p1  ORF type:complete len:692 (-),score=149.44 TRINITY_DN1639_c0_g3_i1:253-2328(-)
MDPLIARERKNASFPVEEMSKVLWGGPEGLEKRLKAQNLVADEPMFNNEETPFLSREAKVARSLKRSKKLFEIVYQSGFLGEFDTTDVMSYEADEQLPVFLHHAMFVPTISGQGTEEQREEWLPKASTFEIIGCYAQTELGHGSFLRGLETVAIYDPANQQFNLNSPTLTSTKWWPGGLGIAATHAIVVAKLIVKGVDHGPHNFIVQIRSLEDHKPLPGVTVGDIGPKFGYSTMDNGFLRFDNVKIPRNALLMRFSQVTPEGEYIKPPHSKVSYGTMVFIRAFIVSGASRVLSRALTIAIRYSAVRKQFPKSESDSPQNGEWDEQPILNYQTQQYKLLPLLAIAYAFHFTKTEMMRMYYTMRSDLKAGKFSSLSEVHAASAGLKAITTETTSNGLEVCRMACGGHGFSAFSGFSELYVDYIPTCTYEGDNTVMLLQTARYLLKSYKAAQKGIELPENLKYLNKSELEVILREKCPVQRPEDFLDFDIQVRMFRRRVAWMLHQVVGQMTKLTRSSPNLSKEAVRELVKVDLTLTTTAYCWQLVQFNFVNVLKNAKTNQLKDAPPSILLVLKNLSDLFTLYHIEQNLGQFNTDSYFSVSQLKYLRQVSRNLLLTIRKDAVPLVDAFQYTDHLLNSAIGRYDGRYAEHLLNWAKKEPLNNISPPVGYQEYLLPLLHPNSFKHSSSSSLPPPSKL